MRDIDELQESPLRAAWVRAQLERATHFGDRFRTWLRDAHKGERFVYWDGHLTVDRMPGADDWAQCETLARLAWDAYRAGVVTLVQKRTGPGEWQYLAVHY